MLLAIAVIVSLAFLTVYIVGFNGGVPKMNTPEDVRKAWVAALRSGKYKQGQGQLRNKRDEYCCLGVLCDLAVQQGLAEWREVVDVWEIYTEGNIMATGSLPPAIATWAGVVFADGAYLDGGGHTRTLATDNDSRRLSFAGIANIIESKPHGMFVATD